MKFVVRELPNDPDTIYVRYDCPCGCKPGVEYTRNRAEAGFEHCCCGNVHFVGPDAARRLEEYLAARQEEDAELGGYTLSQELLPTPWGTTVEVAYAIPAKPRAH